MFAYQYNWQDEGIKDHVFGLSSAVKVAGGTAKLGARYLLGKNDGAAQGAEDKRKMLPRPCHRKTPLDTTAFRSQLV